MITSLLKICRPATVPCHGKILPAQLFVKIGYADGKLSISGVIGPKHNGDAFGGCGQIDMEFAHRRAVNNDRRYKNPIEPENMVFAAGWDKDKWLDLLDVWKDWHLNDMKAGCEHQRAERWGEEEIEVITYSLTSAASSEQRRLKEWAIQTLKETGTVSISPEERALLALPYTMHAAPDADGPGSGRYEVSKRERKMANWVRPDEHPNGVLMKKCPTCGYAYGSAWLRVEVPEDVLEFLSGLPDTDVKPAWC